MIVKEIIGKYSESQENDFLRNAATKSEKFIPAYNPTKSASIVNTSIIKPCLKPL
jgi:hypothetical protein